jgi:hypothetical protein
VPVAVAHHRGHRRPYGDLHRGRRDGRAGRVAVFPLYFLRSFGYAGIGVVAIAAFGALVLLPPCSPCWDPRVNAGRVPWTRPPTARGLAVGGDASPAA